MGSRMQCRCGGMVFINHFYKLIKDIDYDAIDAPVDEDKVSDLFFKKGITAYRCAACGRLIVEWDDHGDPTFYVPEEKQAHRGEIGDASADIVDLVDLAEDEATAAAEPDDPRLKKLEAIAEAAYSEMYDSSYPTGRYSEAKEAFYDAISLARELGRSKDVERLEKRLEHIKSVFRSQFT